MKLQLNNIYEDLTLKPASTVEGEAINLVKFFLSSQPFSYHLISKRARRALFKKRDPELILAIKNELQKITHKVIEQERVLGELVIGRILAFYPFLEPTGTLEVPLYMDGKWKIVSYSIERCTLTPDLLGSPLTAFGLTAPSYPSLFLLMGTALPTISGHLLSLWTDFVPGLAVGELAFQLFAKKRIRSWLEKQSGEVRLYGQSLGAALALHTVCAFEERVSEVHAFCPPALYKRTFSAYQGKAFVQLYWQKKDIVPLVGRGFHPLWKMTYIESEEPQSSFFAHVRVVPAFSPFTAEEKTVSRRLWPLFTFFHFLLSLPIFCITTTIILIKKIKSIASNR